MRVIIDAFVEVKNMNEYDKSLVNFERAGTYLSLYEGPLNHSNVKYDKFMRVFSEILRSSKVFKNIDQNCGLTYDFYEDLAYGWGNLQILDLLNEALDKGVYSWIKYKFDNSKIRKDDVEINDPFVVWAEVEMDKIEEARRRILRKVRKYIV